MKLYLLIISLFSWDLCLGLDYGLPQKLETPLREHSIIITEEGFFPNRISLFEGEKLKLFVTSLNESPSCLFIPDKKLFIGVNRGEVKESETIFEKEGVYHFHCPTGKIHGKITVIRKIGEREKAQRKIASARPSHLWVPKDE